MAGWRSDNFLRKNKRAGKNKNVIKPTKTITKNKKIKSKSTKSLKRARAARIVTTGNKKKKLKQALESHTSQIEEKNEESISIISIPDDPINCSVADASVNDVSIISEDSVSDDDLTVKESITDEDIVQVKKHTRTRALPQDCKVLSIPSTSTVLLAFHNLDECIKFYGRANIGVLRGTCTLHGFKLKPGQPAQNVFAPLTQPAATLQHSMSDEVENKINIDDAAVSLGIDVSTLKDELSEYEVVVMFRKMDNDLEPDSYPFYEHIYKVHAPDAIEFVNLCMGCWACSTSRYFQDSDYVHAMKSILSFKSHKSLYPTIITIGGKNVGKSTFNRYLVNRLIQKYPRVYYLECDIGQTEFTPFGFVSISCIDSTTPLLGPPFTHQQKPKYTCFYGNNSPAGDPDRYIGCIQFVLDSMFRDISGELDGPLVVNTMGWIGNLGLRLLIDTIRMTVPSHVVQVTGKELVLHTPEHVTDANGWMTVHQQSDKTNQHKLLVLEINKSETETFRHYTAADHRNLSLMAHLTKMTSNCFARSGWSVGKDLYKDLQRIRPYQVNVNDIAVCNATDNAIKYKFVLAALNACIIGLCIVDDQLADTLKNPSEDSFLHPHPICHCLGIGLVRGVDPTTNTLYVISELNEWQMNRVNCIACGNLTIPDKLILDRANRDASRTPYSTHNFYRSTCGSRKFVAKKWVKSNRTIK